MDQVTLDGGSASWGGDRPPTLAQMAGRPGTVPIHLLPLPAPDPRELKSAGGDTLPVGSMPMMDGAFDIFRNHRREKSSRGGDSSGRRGFLPDSEADEDEDVCSKVREKMGDGTTEWDATVRTKDEDGEGASSDNHEFVPDPSDLAHGFIYRLPTTTAKNSDPVGFRLMLAISSDGEPPWEKTGMVIANHASVPCLAVEEVDGVETLFLYFVTARGNLEAYNTEDSEAYVGKGVRPTPLAVAYTTDLITWTYRLLDCKEAGFEYRVVDDYGLELKDYSANDPSVVRAIGITPDEKAHPDRDYQWMMYYTLHYGTDSPPSAVILVAFAHQLSDFEWTTGHRGHPVLPPHGAPGKDDHSEARAEDPSAAPVEVEGIDPGYILFAGGNKPGYNWYAGFKNGVTLAGYAQIQETCGGIDDDSGEPIDPILMNNEVDAPGTALDFTWIAAAGPSDLERYIISIPYELTGFKSGTHDTGGCNVILEQDPSLAYEYNGIREAAVAQFGGCWVMVYVTGIEPTSDTPTF